MKKKKAFSKLVAIALTLTLTLSGMPAFPVLAQGTASNEQVTEKCEPWQPEINSDALSTEGDLTLEELQTATLAQEDTPEIVSKESIDENGHVNRLWEQEEDLNTILFQNRDGTKTAYHYSDPVKYTDRNGKVKDKKNKLSETANGDYTNAENDINAYFPKKIHKNKGVELTFGEYRFEMAPNTNGSSGASRQTGHDKNSDPTEYVEYPNVFSTGVSVRYTPTFGGYKEDIILSENVGMNRFEFKLTTNGLSLVQAATGNYYLAEPLTGEYITALGNVVVYDNAGVESEGYNHYYEVTTLTADQQYLVTVVVDEQYLESEDTVYPVYVDPTLTVMPKGAVEDAVLYSKGSETAYSGQIKIGYESTYGTGRGLYDFPILNFSNDFIHMYGNQITSASLQLYALPYGNSSSYDAAKTLSLYEYKSDWSPSTVKWNNTLPDEYEPLAVSSTSVTSGWTAFNILPVIEQFKNNPDYTVAFKGLLLKADSEVYTTWKKFVSSSGATGRRPYITITYNDNPTACAQVVSGATYYLKNYSGKYLDVSNGWTTDNTPLWQYTFNGTPAQQFKIVNVVGGEYEITPQHTTGKVLSVNSSGQVIIETDCDIARQRWYIYYRNGSYHIVNKQYNNGIMSPTYDTDYISINNEYEYCCWDLEKLDNVKNISIIKFNDEYQQVLYTTTFYNGEILAFLEDAEGNRSNVVTVNDENKSFLLDNYTWYNDYWFNGNPNSLSQPPAEYSRIHMAYEKIEAYFLPDSPLVKWSDEYYALWSIVTLVESAYQFYSSLIVETVDTLVVIGGIVYQTVVVAKSIGIAVNQKRTINSSSYSSMSNTCSSFSNITDPQAIDDGITDGSTITKGRRTWLQSEINEALYYPESNGYSPQVSFKKDSSGNIVSAYYGENGSVRIDRYKPGHIVEVKNYNVTTTTGRSNLVNNIRGQYWQRKSFFGSNTQQTYVIDVCGQNVSSSVLLDLENSIYNATETLIEIIFRYD